MKNLLKKRYLLVAVLALVLAAFALRPIFEKGAVSANANMSVVQDSSLQKFTAETLKKYDGTDPSLPIYLAMDGKVYDISAGSEFYKTGGAYHYLAGKDSSFELRMFGGDIIKRKYPVIGRLTNSN